MSADEYRSWSPRNSVVRAFEFDSMIEDLHNDGTNVPDLMDIWENSAYIAFVALIGGYINYDEDGYSILAKEYRRELKYAAGNLMRI